jgi:hypothetical protein
VLVKAVVRNVAGRAGTERKSDHQTKRASEHPSQRKWLVFSYHTIHSSSDWMGIQVEYCW